MRKKELLLFILLLSFFLSNAKRVKAEEIGFSLSPSKLLIQQKTPINITEKLILSNPTEKEILIRIEKIAFEVKNDSPEEITQRPPSNEEKEILIKGIAIKDELNNTDTIKLSPSETKVINLNLNISSISKAKDMHLALLFTQLLKSKDEIKSSSSIGFSNVELQIVMPLIISPVTKGNEDLIIEGIRMNKINFTASPKSLLTLKNNSQNAISGKVTTKTKNIYGKVVMNRTINNKILLSKSINIIDIDQEKDLASGIYSLEAIAAAGSTNHKSSKESLFIVMQKKVILVTIFIALSVLILISRIKLKRKES